ncbi:protein lifeguard 1 [Pholidichthys leucotaenia]
MKACFTPLKPFLELPGELQVPWPDWLGAFEIYIMTCYDFTIRNGILLIIVVNIVMFGIFCSFYYSDIADIGYGCLGTLIYSLAIMELCFDRVARPEPRADQRRVCLTVRKRSSPGLCCCEEFLTNDCQLMMGIMRMDPEDHISAALTIYLDIVFIFLYLLGRR